MNKYERVKSNIQFNEIIQKGKKFRNDFFTIFVVDKKEEESHFGISVPNKTGNAVVRNRVKRQIRALIDDYKIKFPKFKNYIIIVKEVCKSASYDEKAEAILHLIGEINEKENL